ncbi:MAG: ImcF-related family protein [Pseudomonas sp.]
MKTFSSLWRIGAIATLWGAALIAVSWIIHDYGDTLGLGTQGKKLIAFLSILLVGVLALLRPYIAIALKKWQHRDSKMSHFPNPDAQVVAGSLNTLVGEWRRHLRNRYGFFWRRKVRILMLLGNDSAVDAIAPGLSTQKWLEGEGTLLVWGGAAIGEPDAALLAALKQLHRRPLDGLVWVSDNPGISTETTPQVADALLKRYQILGWQVPLYVWALQQSSWDQRARVTQPVGCLLPAGCSPDELAARLGKLPAQLIEPGTRQVLHDPRHDFLLTLADNLAGGGIEKLKSALAALFPTYRPMPVAGIMFSLPLGSSGRTALNHWGMDNSWRSLLDSVGQLPAALLAQRLGWPWLRIARGGLTALLLIGSVGMALSYFTNRGLINDSAEQAKLGGNSQLPLADQLRNQQDLQQTIAMLQHREYHGAPWYSRLGLSQNALLLNRLWPQYQRNNDSLIRDQAVVILQRQLQALVALPMDSPKRAEQAKAGYDQLKAYLMMARPDKAEPAFLSRVLQANWPRRESIEPGIWQALAPALLGFYAENLPAHPHWAIGVDEALVRDARQVLMSQFGVRNAETTLYQNMLQQVAKTHGDLYLDQMIGGTSASALFSGGERVSGVFTRKAWESDVSSAIDKVVKQRREEIDWVLSDSQHLTAEISPEALKLRLTERYFSDFADSWQGFLNSLKWHPAESLSDAIDQLTLVADVRQSPLIALMNTVAYQGKTGQTGGALADSLVESAKNLFSTEQPLIDQRGGVKGPMDETFGPLLALMDGKAGGEGATSLSLQTYLTRVTRVRLKLQQVTHATDPQAMTQALANTVFQGKAVDLSDTRDYGSLIAASLGQEWSGFGHALFMQPMEQAWHQVLAPTAESLNHQWKTEIVDDWNGAFSGRYPFNNVASDASLPLLARYLRADSGNLQRFLEGRLAGVLRKQGRRWVPDAANAQGLRFNPAFLEAVNTLSQLSDVVFTNGDARLHFDLRAGTARNVMQTDLTIDSQKLTHFNQMATWKRQQWPADTTAPGATLSWISTSTGSRLYADLPGPWGLIRLLEKARITPNQGVSSSFDLSWTAQDGLPLNYTLRTELDDGPLTLLKLRGFVLPAQIFLTERAVRSES